MKRAGMCLLICLGLLVAAAPGWSVLSDAANLFGACQYEAAREVLQRGGKGARPGEEALWRSRLSEDPAEALAFLQDCFRDPDCSQPVRVRLALEITGIQAGRGDYQDVLNVLGPLVSGDETHMPGILFLRAAIAYRARGRLQQAREMLASIRPGDPQFPLARYYLGDIGLQQHDTPLAQRYFEAANKSGGDERQGRLAAGSWQAEMLHGNTVTAERLHERLQSTDPGCLALLEINRLMRAEADERQARAIAVPVDTVVTGIRETAGRYTLQLGAFSDRRLALAFVQDHGERVEGLQVVTDRDELGQVLYKVRAGEFVNPAVARNRARKLQADLGLPVIVAEVSRTGRRDRP